MSKLDIINDEIARRENANTDLIQGQQAILDAVEQFNKLDEMYKEDERAARTRLECLYKENRHFTGQWPIVYSQSDVEFYPFYSGELDEKCNPYFPITKIQDGTFDGLQPLKAEITRTGAYARERAYTETEDIPRSAALTELNNFPDISGEPLPAGWPGPQTTTSYCTGEDNPPQLTQAACEADNGTWVEDPVPDPVWNGPDTAPALLRTALEGWKADIEVIIADLCEDSGTEEAFWQGIIDDIDIVLAAVATDAVFVRATGNSDPAAWGQTQDFTPSSAEDLARDRLITAAQTGVPSHISTRQSFLDGEAATEEEVFFGVVKLRLHQANGSFAKMKAAKGQIATNKSIIADNNSAIKSLNVLKVKNS